MKSALTPAGAVTFGGKGFRKEVADKITIRHKEICAVLGDFIARIAVRAAHREPRPLEPHASRSAHAGTNRCQPGGVDNQAGAAARLRL